MEWQTAEILIRLLLQEQSDLGLHCLHMSFFSDTLVFEILGHLLYILCPRYLKTTKVVRSEHRYSRGHELDDVKL